LRGPCIRDGKFLTKINEEGEIIDPISDVCKTRNTPGTPRNTPGTPPEHPGTPPEQPGTARNNPGTPLEHPIIP